MRTRRAVALVVCGILMIGIAFSGCDGNPSGADDGGYYIGNVNTKKFHYPDCSYLPDPENRVRLDSCQEASDLGYDPCGHCEPCS